MSSKKKKIKRTRYEHSRLALRNDIHNIMDELCFNAHKKSAFEMQEAIESVSRGLQFTAQALMKKKKDG